MRYWWVNHKQTVKHEVNGGFLWSPKTKKGNIKNRYYDNLCIAAPGDKVLSYANKKVAYVGVVTDFAISASKPEFGAAVSFGVMMVGYSLSIGRNSPTL
ncbi:Uncharacterised protein [Hafnia alvei]|uniref:Uncharacterized protein n=1 Tax=Hafnia alvei TaxID=569 RepID=A0A377PNR3_HAFAL|nr:Uncharacterised protein [Hafnia alvei]